MGLGLGSSGKNRIQPAEEKCYIDKVELAILGRNYSQIFRGYGETYFDLEISWPSDYFCVFYIYVDDMFYKSNSQGMSPSFYFYKFETAATLKEPNENITDDISLALRP